MRIVTYFLASLLVFFGAFAQASSTYHTEKVKTGILPSGDFFSIYEVDCPDKFTAAVARLDGNTRWCTSYDGELSCFLRKQEASLKACGSRAVASRDGSLDGTYKPQ